MTFTPEQERELRTLMATYPYRIVYATKDKVTGEFFASAVTSMRIPNRIRRDGHEVVIVKGQ